MPEDLTTLIDRHHEQLQKDLEEAQVHRALLHAKIKEIERQLNTHALYQSALNQSATAPPDVVVGS